MERTSHRIFKNRLYGLFARIGKALSNPHRLEMLELLAQGERTVDSLASDTGLSVANASQHLQALRQAALVESRKDGLFVHYRLAAPGVFELSKVIRTVAEDRLADLDRLVREHFADRDEAEAVPIDELLKRARSKEVRHHHILLRCDRWCPDGRNSAASNGLNAEKSEDAMARTCPVDLDTLRLRTEIESIYRRVATEPSGDFHFHRGPTYAAEMLGYDAVALARLPVDSTASFAGVANPHRIVPIAAGATVVDIGCGAGMDLILAAEAAGPGGRAIGVDMTKAMAERARTGARSLGLANVEVRLGDAMSLPVDSESVDVVISNGVLNLTPDKEQAFGEVFRILKPGGQFLYGDIVVATELAESIRRNIDLWTG